MLCLISYLPGSELVTSYNDIIVWTRGRLDCYIVGILICRQSRLGGLMVLFSDFHEIAKCCWFYLIPYVNDRKVIMMGELFLTNKANILTRDWRGFMMVCNCWWDTVIRRNMWLSQKVYLSLIGMVALAGDEMASRQIVVYCKTASWLLFHHDSAEGWWTWIFWYQRRDRKVATKYCLPHV